MNAKMLRFQLIVVWTLLYGVSIINGQDMQDSYENDTSIEDIRLVNQTANGNGGRVEVLYGQVWGTICDNSWDVRDAEVACRMLGFDGVVCATRSSRFRSSTYYGYQPIHMSELTCTGDESALDLCSFAGWGESYSSYCNAYRHHHDAGVICRNNSQESSIANVGVPYNISLNKSSTTFLTIQWIEPESSGDSTGNSYTISYKQSSATSYVQLTYTPTSYEAGQTVNYTLTYLSRDTEYNVRIRMNVNYPGSSLCSSSNYRRFYGNYSDVLTFRTNATAKQSNITVRLVSSSTTTPYLGRVEVLHNNVWGTICDDYFYTDEANVICRMLNYTGAFCAVPNSGLGRGSGRIWLDDVDCDATAEVLEDCTHRGWGITSCSSYYYSHYNDVGVVCNPGLTTLPPVQNFHVNITGPNYVTVGWDLYRTFPPSAYIKRLRLYYESESGSRRSYTLYSSSTQYTIRSLSFNTTYNIIIQAYVRFSSYCSSSYVYGETSNVTITTTEAAPSRPPRSFRVTVLSDTSIRAEWQLPSTSYLNGIVRGFNVFLRPASGGDERTINITNNVTNMYTFTELQPATAYYISALIYTIADGPRTSSLIAITHSISNDSAIEGIRLVDQVGYGGRVEVLYQQVWGTICDTNWDKNDAEVACRMLGFEGAVCSTSNSRFRQTYLYSYQRIHMSNLNCSGSESALDRCGFRGWGQAPFCNSYRHRDDAGVVCRDDIQENAIIASIGVPYNLTLIRASTRALTIQWTKPVSGASSTGHTYTISYKLTNATSYVNLTYTPNVNHLAGQTINYTIRSLLRDTGYNVRVRMNVDSPGSTYCSLSYLGYYKLSGNYSDEVTFRTNTTAIQSSIPVRLISPTFGASYLGRVEVQYNGVWGTVCDDSFYTNEANVICWMLNYTEGALCAVSSARLGSGYGTIWLDDLNCDADAEILEDCTHNGWGIEDCGHYEDVGVVCNPGSSILPAVQNVTVIGHGSNNIRIGWNRYTAFPRGSYSNWMRVYYESESGIRSYDTVYVSSSTTQYTIQYLSFNTTYNITIQPLTRISSYCSAYVYGTYSEEISATTVESAPSSSPTMFQVTVINSTSIEAEWALPPAYSHNGIIRGFKLFWKPAALGGVERTINIANNYTEVYAITGLQPATAYTISILAYTIADGPRSLHHTAITYRFDPLISTFGINGNGLIKETRYISSYSYGRVNIHCGVYNPDNVTVQWYFANGSLITSADRNFQSVYHINGTAILRIANYRRLSYCDGGVFYCVVNGTNTVGRIEKRNFTLVINFSPPTPDRPFSVKRWSNGITIGWRRPICDGGHLWSTITIRYRRSGYYYSYTYIRNINASVGNHTITGLSSNRAYTFYIQATTVDGLSTSYSPVLTASTFPPAPSAPREVRAVLLTTNIVQVTWRVPAITNGVINRYTVYATPVVLLPAGGSPDIRARRQAEPEPTSSTNSVPQTIVRVFPGTATAGNITLEAHSITYQFQVRASLLVNGVLNDGALSPITMNSTLFVPEPGRPTPANVRVNRTSNASITLIWDYPPPPAETVQRFLIEYDGNTEWRSEIGNLYFFEDSGEVSTESNTIKISPLFPGTEYQFKVSAISAKGRGAEVSQSGETLPANAGTFGHLQLRFGPIENCFQFKNGDGNTTAQLLKVRRSVVTEMTYLCPRCGFTINNIKGDEFSCLAGLHKQIIYRARIIGTDVYSAPDFVSLMGSMVGTGRGSIIVDFTRLYLDPTCPTPIFSLKAHVCGVDIHATTEPTTEESTTQAVTKATAKPTEPGKDTAKRTSEATVGEIGTIVTGVIIIILLATLIIIIVVLVLRRMKQKNKRDFSHRTMSEFSATYGDHGSHPDDVFNDDAKEEKGL